MPLEKENKTGVSFPKDQQELNPTLITIKVSLIDILSLQYCNTALGMCIFQNVRQFYTHQKKARCTTLAAAAGIRTSVINSFIIK